MDDKRHSFAKSARWDRRRTFFGAPFGGSAKVSCCAVPEKIGSDVFCSGPVFFDRVVCFQWFEEVFCVLLASALHSRVIRR